MKCEVCNAKMIYKQEGSSCSWICPNCGWGLATTYNSPMELDMKKYTIQIVLVPKPSIEMIRCISKVFNKNFIHTKEAIQTGTLLISDYACAINDIRNVLKSEKIKYIISPKFPY